MRSRSHIGDLNGAAFVMLSFPCEVGLSRIFYGWIRSKAKYLSVDFYMSSPIFPVSMNAENARTFIVGSSISRILRVDLLRNIAKICNRVIFPVPVYVVNVESRPLTVNEQPRESMKQRAAISYARFKVTSSAFVTDNLACIHSVAGKFPRKNSGFRIVVNKTSKFFCRNIRLSHDAILSLIGQRPANVTSVSLASLF